jgi:tRNA pseudouridine55 synthase
MSSSPAGSGLVVVDKPAGWTSHDVVARVRRLAGTRRVGHAGTLDPMATGVLVLGVDRATRLLGHLALTVKAYDATIRLGVSTTTDDAMGEATAAASAADLADSDIMSGVAALIGDIEQVPPTVSAVKIGGRRSYALARAGEAVALGARPVTVYRFDVRDIRRVGDVIDLDVSVTCSAGTYVRALARDLGARLGVGGHLAMLRRTRVGPYSLEAAHTLDELAREFVLIPLEEAVAGAFPRRDVDERDAVRLANGVQLPAAGIDGTYAAFAPDGTFLALLEDRGPVAKPVAVFARSRNRDH